MAVVLLTGGLISYGLAGRGSAPQAISVPTTQETPDQQSPASGSDSAAASPTEAPVLSTAVPPSAGPVHSGGVSPARPHPSGSQPTPPPPGTRSAYTVIRAESYTAQSGTQAEPCTDVGGGQDMGYLAPGDWLAYDKVDFGSAGATRFLVRFASNLPAGMNGAVEVRLDAPDHPVVGSAAVASTGGWQNFVTVPANLTRATGVHTVYLTFASSSGWEIGNVNWFTFEH
jgi:hypothetical protein